MKKIPIPTIAFVLSVAVLGLARSALWFFLGLEVEKAELWSVLGVSTSGGLLYQALPVASQNFLTALTRQYLSSRLSVVFLFVLGGGLLLPIMTISYIDISWRGPKKLTIEINSLAQVLDSDSPSTDVFTIRKYGLAFSALEVRQGNWVERKSFYPLARQVIQVPFSVTNASAPEVLEIEEQLELSFFQFFEARYINNAKNKLSALAQSERMRETVERLGFIYEILRMDFLEIDLSDKKGLLLESFAKRYPNDPWENLLKAANYYGDKNYRACADVLKPRSLISAYPQRSTEDFFRGVCLLKASRDAKTANDRDSLSNFAIAQFQSAEKLLWSHDEGVFRSLALPSSIHFQGIANYYRGRTDDTISFFKKASEVSSGGLKARTLNGLGYIQLSRGNLELAEIALLEAMESDPTFPLARSNYGYVLMDRGDFKKAREIFTKNASDDRLKIESYRDVVLAKLALVHLSELVGASTPVTLAQYEPVLAELKIQTFDGVNPDILRLANIHRAIGRNVYLSKDYYGLEIYALALLTRAYLEIEDLASAGQVDIRVATLLEALSSDIEATKSMVSQDWLNRPQSGWFATIDGYQKRRGKLIAQPLARDAPQAAHP